MRFDAVVEPVVDGAQSEVVLEFAEGVFDLSLEHVLFPEGFGIAVGEVGPQQVGAFVLGAGFADAGPVEVPLEGVGRDGFAFFGDGDGDQLPGAPGLGLGDGEAGDEFVAGEGALRRGCGEPFRAADAGVQGAEGLHGGAEFLHAHGHFLEGAGVALGQDEGVAFPAVLVEGARDFHADAGLDFLPCGLFQPVAENAEAAARGPDEVLVAALAHLAEGFFGRHPAVHQPEVADFAVLGLELADERHLRARVGGVAGVHFVGEGEAVGRQDERHHHLQAVAALVSAVAVALQFAVEGLGAVDLEVRARQIEEHHVARRVEQPRPPLAQEPEQPVLEGVLVLAARLLPFVEGPEHAVEAVVERRAAGERARVDEFRDGRVGQPLAVHPQFAPGVRQAVEHDALENRQPVRPLASGDEAPRPEGVQPEPVPQFQPQPDLAPVAQVPHRQPVHPDPDQLSVAFTGRRTVGREKGELARMAFLVERLDRVLPPRALRVVELAEIEGLALEHAPAGTHALHQTPVHMDFAILATLVRFQKHATILSCSRDGARG